MGYYTSINEGITGLTPAEKEGLNKIKNSIKGLFKKKKDKNNDRQSQKNVKVIPLDRADFDKARKELLKALTRICKSYNNSSIKAEIFEYSDTEIIFEIFHEDQEFNIDHLDILYDIGNQLEDSDEFKAISEYAGIDIGYGDGDEGCIYVTIANYQIVESASIFESCEFI